MGSNERIARYTDEELREMVRCGEDRTDWARIDAMTPEEIKANVDVEDEGDFSQVDPDDYIIGYPHPPREVTLRIDGDILDWFAAHHEHGLDRDINQVLRRHVEAHKRQALKEAQEAAARVAR